MKKFENPAYENYDLEIKNKKDLEDAKKEAGVKSHRDASMNILSHAKETGDKKLEASVKEEVASHYLNEGVPAEKEISAETREKIKGRENFLKKYFPEARIDLSKLEVPERTPEEEKELTRLLLRTKKLALFKKCEELFPSVNHTSVDLDNLIANSDIEDSFIWVRDTEAADEEHKNKSFNMAEKEGLNAETIVDRIMHELEYFNETGDHLDKETGTLTTSRDADGSVLYASWSGGKFHVGWSGPDSHDARGRFRQVVSSPTKSEK